MLICLGQLHVASVIYVHVYWICILNFETVEYVQYVKMNKKPANNRKNANIYQNMNVEEVANMCDRLVLFHTTGIYQPPDQKPHSCQNKNKRKKTVSRVAPHNNNIQKTTFGQGRIGLSCESYGVKNCACCYPYSESGVVATSSVFNLDDFNYFTSDDDDVVIVGSYPNPSKSPLLSITINDEPCISTCDPVLGVLNTDDVLDRGQSNSSSLIKNVSKREANPQEILDYVDLVTNDLDEENLEEQFMKLIQNELEEEKNKPIKKENGNNNHLHTASSSNSAVNISALSLIEVLDTANKENIALTNKSSINPSKLKTALTKQRKNISNVIEIADSPAKAPVSDSTRNNLECSICLESFMNKEVMSTICGHLFCAACIKHAIKQSRQCPNCRKKLSLKGIHPIFL